MRSQGKQRWQNKNLHQNRLISQGKSNFTDEKCYRTSFFRTSSMVGRASCVGLLALGFMLVNPLMRTSARALEVAEEGGGEASEAGVDGVETRADDSRVSIAFTPTSISGEMTPTTEAGLKKQLEVTATVTIQNAEDYTVYIGAKTTGLTGKNTGATIESVKVATDYDDLPTNAWGMYYAERSSVPGNATYQPVETGRGAIVGSGGRSTSTITKTYALGFAANINSEMPADMYENKITMSVVSSPIQRYAANDSRYL